MTTIDNLHKETNQQRSGEESAAVHSPFHCWPSGYQHTKLLMIDTLRCSQKADASESRWHSAESFFSFLIAARLREMALKNVVFGSLSKFLACFLKLDMQRNAVG